MYYCDPLSYYYHCCCVLLILPNSYLLWDGESKVYVVVMTLMPLG